MVSFYDLRDPISVVCSKHVLTIVNHHHQLCCSSDDIIRMLTLRAQPLYAGGPRPRLSLYLSSQLMFGCVKVYNKQSDYLLSESRLFSSCLKFEAVWSQQERCLLRERSGLS